MIAETDGGMIEVLTEMPEDKLMEIPYIEIPKDCDPLRFMNIYALENWKKGKFVFYDKHKIVKEEHLRG